MAFNWKGLANEVAVKRTAITTVIVGAIHAVVALHWLTVAQSDETIKAVTGAIDFIGAGAGALYVRAGVSPAKVISAVAEDINAGGVVPPPPPVVVPNPNNVVS